jgi:hypothetical protein
VTSQKPTPKKKPEPREPILSVRATRYIVYVVLGIWATSAVVGMFPKVFGYTPPPEIHAAFMAVMGLVLAAGGLRRGGDE